MQSILKLDTRNLGMRAEVVGWSVESGFEVGFAATNNKTTIDKVPTWKIKRPQLTYYQTPLHALGDGWKLLAPPIKVGNICEWFFTKD